ncbi:MAG TPA: NAD(P)H-binding protein [Trinickia sp.]|uniref:NmrA family NAD(P)-binding protein n=1 Tax=Trinickia sp. TaxID=2571163 RepID=UPI002F4294BD
MFVIFGASGNVGRATVTALVEAGKPVRAVVHDRAQGNAFARMGCDVVVCELADSAAVQRALEGAYAVQMLCPVPRGDTEPADTMRRAIDAVETALRARPPSVVLALSDYGAEKPRGTGITVLFHELEQRWRGIAARSIMLRSAEHMHNWARVMPLALQTAVLPSFHHPLSKQFPTVAASDVGRVAAQLLLDESEQALRVVSVECEHRVNAFEVAQTLGQASGRHIDAVAVPREAWEQTLAHAGLSAAHVALIVELYDAHNAGMIDVEAGAGERRFGSTSLREVFDEIVPRVMAMRNASVGGEQL